VQVVGSDHEGKKVTSLITLMDCILDDLSRILMEILECNG
jgi:hypothetical protein